METFETILNAANDFFNQNNYDEALTEYEKALAVCEADEQKYSETATVNSQMGKTYRKKGDYEKAIESHQKAAEILKNALGEEHFKTAIAYNDLGVTYYRAGGKYGEALQWYLKAAEIRKKVTGERKTATATVYSNIAESYTKLDQQTEAAAWYVKSISVHNNVIVDYVKKGDYTKADEYGEKISELAKNVLPGSRREITAVYSRLAETFANKGKYYDALKWYNRIFEIESEETESLENQDESFTSNWLGISDKYVCFHDKYADIQKAIHINAEREYENLLNLNGKASEEKKEINSYKNKAVSKESSKKGFTESGIFLRKARGTDISRQAQRVFLCFDRAGSQMAGDIIDDVLSDDAGMDCVVSFVDINKQFNEDDLRAELKETRVLAVYVTLDMLESISTDSIPVELRIAKELNIPILPIAQDDGLLPSFTEKIGKLHGIARNDAEYRTKLKAQLENFLASEGLQKNIASQAFTAEIFLSYRKVDLEEARAFMKDLHTIEGLQGISVWYDHFLTAGREFDTEIREAIENSSAFVLLVTPHITEKNAAGEINYVAREEAPFAVEKEKPIIPVEVKPRDASTFAVLFPNIGEPVSPSVLNEAFRAKLGEKAYIKALGSERAYLLGMAYLLGYRMERDTGHAIKLLKESAAAHDKFALDAAEQLAKIYEQGLLGSFSVDYNEALSWRQRAISINKRIYGKKHPHTAKAYNNIGKVLYNLGNYKEALRYYNRSYRINKKAFGLNHLSIAENYNNIGEVYIKLNKILGISVLYDALKIYQDEYGEDNLVVADTLVNIGRIDNENEFFRNLNKSLIALADIVNGKIDELSDGGINKSFVRFQKALEIYHKTYGEYHYSVAAAYTYLGRLYILHEKYTEALENLFKSLSIFEKIYGQNHPFIVFPLINIALAYSHLNENNKAIDYFSKALSLEKKFSIENQPALKQLYREIGELYLRLNNYSEALKYFVEDVENLAADYDADEENKKQERKYYNNKKGFNRFLKITSKFKNKFLYVFSLIFFGIIFMLIALPKGIVGIVKLIVSFKGFGKKIKKNSGKNGQFGSTVYSSFNYLDSQTMFYSMLVNIRDKYIQIGDICCMANEYNAALDYYNKALDIFKRMNDEEERVSANITLYYDMGSAYFHLGNIDRALFFCGKAFEFKKFPFGRVGEAKDDAETAKLYNIIGEIYFRTNQFEKALEQFHKTVTVYEKLNSDEDGNNHQELALAYNNSGKTHAALEKPEKATEFYSKAVSEYKHLAVTCRNRRKYDEALEWYLKVADLYVLSPGGESEEMGGICNQIGGLYYIRHNYDKSLEWYTKALEICKQIFGGKHSNTAHVLQNIADVFLAQGSDTTALEWLEKSLDIRQEVFAARQQAAMTTGNDADCLETFRIDPKYAGAYYNRGNRYYDKKDYDLAIADFSEALRINPNSAESYTCRGNAYGNGKKDYDQAIADYNEALRIRPNYAWAYNCRGYAYSNKKDYDRAVADYNEAIRLKPDYILAYNNRGLVYMSKGDYDSAITNYTELLRFDPNNTAAYKYRAYAYNGKGDHDRAIVDYTEALRLGPDNAVIYNSRGWSYYLKGDYKRALEDANKSLSIRPDDTNTLDTRANAYYGLGDFDSAIADWEAALKLDPDNAGIRESLEKARADKAGY